MYLQSSCFYLQTEGVVWSFQKFLYLTFNTNIKYLWLYSPRFQLPLVSHGMQILNKNFRNKKTRRFPIAYHSESYDEIPSSVLWRTWVNTLEHAHILCPTNTHYWGRLNFQINCLVISAHALIIQILLHDGSKAQRIMIVVIWICQRGSVKDFLFKCERWKVLVW